MPKKATKKKSSPKPKAKKSKKGFDDEDEPVEKKLTHEEQDGEDLTKEDYEDKIVKKEVDEDVYTEEGREELKDDDELEDWEEGFSKGAAPDKHHK